MNTDTFDYESFLGVNLENVDTLSNNTTSPVTTFSETDTDSGVGCTPPMNLDFDDTVINLDNFDLFPIGMENTLTDDLNDDFERFFDRLNNENPTVSVDDSTYGNLFSVPSVPQSQEAPQQLSPSPPVLSPPQPNVPSVTNCIRIQSFIPSITGGARIIKYEATNPNPNITIIKTTKPITVPATPIVTLPVVTTNDSILKPVNSITPPAIKRRRSDSPSEQQQQQQTFEIPAATIEQLKLQHGNMSEEALKKYIRMIKNRESASLSRKRRKELMENLDVTNKQLKDENEQLKLENSKLLTRIHTLEMENRLLKEYTNRDLSTSARKPLILMGIVLLVVFAPFAIKSFGPTTNLPNSMELYNNEAAIIPSRTLLENSRNIDQNSYSTNSDYDYGPNGNANSPTYPYIQCVAFINKTHSQRINQDLRSWVQDQSDKQLNNQPTIIPDPKSLVIQSNSVVQTNKDSVIEPLHHTTRKVARQTRTQTENKGQLQPYKTYEANYDDFIHSLDRKNDTLYFVSFKRDHLILPATIQNQTQRPKMSLILPASMANLNKSIHVPTNHVPMIKIDCEVEDTKLVFVKRAHIPSSYRNDLFQYYSSVPQTTI